MQIIIPLTGYGSRFVAAGYKDLKPLINVQGFPIIKWILQGMYPTEKNILFVCRKEHLESIPALEQILRDAAPTAHIFAVDQWTKKGPVYDVLRASAMIDDQIPVIINYCDFYMNWEWRRFKEDVIERGCDGCVPCYTGFHPHLLPRKNVYASCKVDENEDLVEIREKYSFEREKSKDRHSPGVYYFKTGAILKHYCKQLINAGEMLNGEYYASLPYNYMVKDGCHVWVPNNVRHFCQWGTPEDLQEYLFWTEIIRKVELK